MKKQSNKFARLLSIIMVILISTSMFTFAGCADNTPASYYATENSKLELKLYTYAYSDLELNETDGEYEYGGFELNKVDGEYVHNNIFSPGKRGYSAKLFLNGVVLAIYSHSTNRGYNRDLIDVDYECIEGDQTKGYNEFIYAKGKYKITYTVRKYIGNAGTYRTIGFRFDENGDLASDCKGYEISPELLGELGKDIKYTMYVEILGENE